MVIKLHFTSKLQNMSCAFSQSLILCTRHILVKDNSNEYIFSDTTVKLSNLIISFKVIGPFTMLSNIAAVPVKFKLAVTRNSNNSTRSSKLENSSIESGVEDTGFIARLIFQIRVHVNLAVLLLETGKFLSRDPRGGKQLYIWWAYYLNRLFCPAGWTSFDSALLCASAG